MRMLRLGAFCSFSLVLSGLVPSFDQDPNPSGLIGKVDEIMPAGAIIIWSGALDRIPAGWVLCDGNNQTPDLRDRFIVGAGEDYEVGDRGGEKKVALAEAHLPSHAHGATATAGQHSHSIPLAALGYASGGSGAFTWRNPAASTQDIDHRSDSESISISVQIAASGGNETHENRPPYLALAYIMYRGLAEKPEGSLD